MIEVVIVVTTWAALFVFGISCVFTDADRWDN